VVAAAPLFFDELQPARTTAIALVALTTAISVPRCVASGLVPVGRCFICSPSHL
jgi:hypothetical protein